MTSDNNVQIVKEGYAAFGRGDLKTLLSLMSPDIVWLGVYGAARHVPTAGERRGLKAVEEFFQQVAKTVNFSSFKPEEFVASGDKVVALGHYTAKVMGVRDFDSDFAMVFTLRDGKITRFQEFTDSAAINAAYAPM